MRKPAVPDRLPLWTAFALCIVVPALALSSLAQSSAPKIRFDESSHDFGDLRSDEKASFDWPFHNDGDQPLEILGTKTSCGCTMTVVESELVPPGGTGTIRVEFDAAGMQGSVRKTLAVTSNDPVHSMVRLTVRAHVTPIDRPPTPGGHPPIAGQSLLMGDCASCHATPAKGLTGHSLYEAVCAMCHGAAATGDRAPSLRHPSYLGERTDRELVDGIAYGTANPRMPGFSELMGGPLSEEQIQSLVRLLREWGPSDETGTGSGEASSDESD